MTYAQLKGRVDLKGRKVTGLTDTKRNIRKDDICVIEDILDRWVLFSEKKSGQCWPVPFESSGEIRILREVTIEEVREHFGEDIIIKL